MTIAPGSSSSVCLFDVGSGLWAVDPHPSGDVPLAADPTQINTERAKAMNTNMQGHNHDGKNHLLWMLGIGGAVLAVQLGLGRSFSQSLSLAFFVACPLMMIGMMFMMGNGNGQQHGNDANERHDHEGRNDDTDERGNHAPAPWQDSPNMAPARPQDTTGTDGPRRAGS